MRNRIIGKPSGKQFAQGFSISMEVADYLSDRYAELMGMYLVEPSHNLLETPYMLSALRRLLDPSLVSNMIETDAGVGYLLGVLDSLHADKNSIGAHRA